MSEVRLEVSDDLSLNDRSRLDDLLDRENMIRTGIHDARLLSVEARDSDGQVLGGLHGHTWGGYCEIRTIFVMKMCRGRDIGRWLMEAAETEAAARGCRQSILATHGFQAPQFYEKLGYLCVGNIAGCPIGDSYLVMVKSLV